MKKGLILFLLVVLVGSVYASVNVSNLNIKESYYSNENLSGTLNLTIRDESLNSFLRTSQNHSVSIKSFLDANSAAYSCLGGCSKKFSVINTSSSITVPVVSGQESVFGFNITGTNMNILSIKFDLTSDFKEGSDVPLSVNFFNKYQWQFKKFSNNFSRSVSYGCFETPELIDYLYELSNQSMYCEKISIPETSSIEVGAFIYGTEPASFLMKLYYPTLAEGPSCQFSAPTNNSCLITSESGTTFNQGEYVVCIKASDNKKYKISSELASSPFCGWIGTPSQMPSFANSSFDLGIFAKTPNYASAGTFNINSSLVPNLPQHANAYILDNYKKNCNGGCLLPVTLSGVSQNITISNVEITYLGPGQLSSNSVSNILTTYSNFNFSGLISLGPAGFDVGGKGIKNISFFLGNNLLFTKMINVVSSTTLNYVTPNNPPAGVETEFVLYLTADRNVTKYLWNWGDNSSSETLTPWAKHKYGAVSLYFLNLTIIDAQNNSLSKNFEISAGSPRELINISLNYKKNSLENAAQTISRFPAWYQSELTKMTNMSFFQDELRRIETSKANAISDEDFVNLMARIQSLDVPFAVILKESRTSPLVTNLEEIDPYVINEFAGGSVENPDDYRNSILQWQNENIQSNIISHQLNLISSLKEQSELIAVQSVVVTSNSPDESYLVIDKPFDDLYFNGDASARKIGDSTLIVLNPGETKNFEFYFKGKTMPSIFISPKLSLLPSPVIGACNFNKVCEPDLEEDYKNCRSDCFPTNPAIFYFSLLLVFAVLAYSLLAYWYKTRYENFLFNDRRILYNLLMFITNARISGMAEDKISDALKKQGWNSEQISYAIKKSKGERIGMPEIIPFDKISAFFREKKAKQNINKGPIQGINRW